MYATRREAGRKLAEVLKQYSGKNTVVLALPRGGVVLGAEVAEKLRVPLDVALVRKIGHPLSQEYAIGAVVRGEEPIVNQDEAADEAWLKQVVEDEQAVNERRYNLYYGSSAKNPSKTPSPGSKSPDSGHNPSLSRQRSPSYASSTKTNSDSESGNFDQGERFWTGSKPVALKDKTVIIVDDGIATGLTMEAAVRAVKRQSPEQIIVAVPVAPPDSVEMLEEIADKVIVLDNPEEFTGSVGAHYKEFTQVEDDEVKLLLREHNQPKGAAGDDSA